MCILDDILQNIIDDLIGFYVNLSGRHRDASGGLRIGTKHRPMLNSYKNYAQTRTVFSMQRMFIHYSRQRKTLDW